MQSSPVQTLVRAGLHSLSAGALLALLSLYAWTQQREWVDSLEAWLIERHVARPTALADEATEARQTDPLRAIQLAEELVAELPPVFPDDRLEPVKERALELLVHENARIGQIEEAVEACEQWVELKPNDIRARLLLGQLLYQHPPRRSEGLERIEALFRLLPEIDYVEASWIDHLLSEGRYADAGEAAHISARAPRSNLWSVWWHDGRPDEPQAAYVTPHLTGDQLRLELTLRGPVAGVRVELPVGAVLTLVDPVLVIRDHEKETTIRLAESDVAVANIERSGTVFSQRPGLDRTGIQIPVPEPLRSETVDLTLRGAVIHGQSSALARLTSDEVLPTVTAALREAGSTDALDWIAGASLSRLAGHGVGVRLHSVQSDGSTSQRSYPTVLGGRLVGDRLEFGTSVRVGTPVSRVQISLPGVLGTAFGIESVELSLGDELRVIDVDAIEAISIEGLTRDGAVFTVTDPRPSLSFDLDESGQRVDAVRIRGWAR